MVVANWRERVAQTETAAIAHLGELPYVTGLAVIGSVGRGDPWRAGDVG